MMASPHSSRPVAALFVALALVWLPSEALAGGNLDIRTWLDRPGVKVVAVEFYATWCKPCMTSVPRWKALHEKYRDDGFRLIVINTLDPGGGCSQVPWNPDHRVCDDDGFIGTSFGVGGNLPAAFLWSWQGDLLVKKGHIDTIEQQVKKYLKKNPRIAVEAFGPDGKADELMETMVRTEIQMSGKFEVVVSKEARKKLADMRKKSHSLAGRADHRCKVGAAMSANSLLTAKVLGSGHNQKLSLSLKSAETGCLLASNWVGYSSKRASQAVREGVVGMIDKLRNPPEHPKGGRFGSRPRGGGGAAPVVKESHIGGNEAEWDPNSAAPPQAILKLRSNPAGAVVFVDGRLFCKSTPCSKAMDLGRRNIDMQMDAYVAKREVVDVKGSETLVWELQPDFATVKIETTPPQIPVMVDGKERKPGELGELRLSAGPHEFVVEGRCFYKAGERVVVKRGETRTVTIAPKMRPSAIKVQAVDEKGNDLVAKVIVDGKPLDGETPKVFAVPVCSKKVRVVAEGRAPFVTALNLEEKQVQPINATLRKDAVIGMLGSAKDGVGGMGFRVSGKLSGKNETYRKECDRSVARSCNWLGLAYHNGTGAPRNKATALQLFLKGCTLGYKISCGNAGNAYKNGWGTSKNATLAVRLYSKGCNSSHAHSCNELGLMYHFGRGGLSKDRREALRLFERGCNLGNKVSCGNAGNAHKDGWGTRKNYHTAGLRYTRGCSKGHAHSCNEQGIFYHFGRGHNKDRSRALVLFKKACNLGNDVSCSNVGNAYKNGWGTSKNRYEAKRWYKKACDKGKKSACTQMRKM